MAGLVTGVKAHAVKKVLSYLNENPEKGFDKIMKLVSMMDDTDFFKTQRQVIQDVLNNPDSLNVLGFRIFCAYPDNKAGIRIDKFIILVLYIFSIF